MENGGAHIMEEHITHKGGEKKTVCVTAVLTALGIDKGSFRYTGNLNNGRRNRILNRNGFACRSRLSAVGYHTTTGKARGKIRELNEGAHVKYMVSLSYGGSSHLILMNHRGETIIDTDPRQRDARKIEGIHAVWKK